MLGFEGFQGAWRQCTGRRLQIDDHVGVFSRVQKDDLQTPLGGSRDSVDVLITTINHVVTAVIDTVSY